jgi:heterodisulfide reductase subunit A
LVECGRHLNIELLTLSEIEQVTGQQGNFQVTLRKQPRYVDMDKCIACGLCSQKCPKKVDDEYQEGVGQRKAIYISYSQTVPLKYVIDKEHCIYFVKGKCKACEKFCPTGAINFDDKEEIVTLNVGSVILAPGYKPFDPSGLDLYGYEQLPDVVTGLEYERLLSASGPYQGHLMQPSTGREPKKIAWIQCVGSRNKACGNGYCSTVCCMYAVKQSLVTAEHLHGGDVQQTIFFMDLRSHNKEFERYYEGAKAKGVRFIRSRPHSIDPGDKNIGAKIYYMTEDGQQLKEDFDMVVLSVGLEAPKDALELAEKFGIELDQYRFADAPSFAPVSTNRDGVYVCGAFQNPKAIPRSVTEASAAASAAAKNLVQARGTLTKEKTYPPERDVAGEEPRVGVFVCSCGINIANTVNVPEVVEYAKTLPFVQFVDNNLFSCSTDTQVTMAEKIKDQNLNRIVVAACTPRTHEALFQDTLREAGLNAYMLEMANIRNQNSWVHQGNPEAATVKAKDQVRMAVAKAIRNFPLQRLSVQVSQHALVIGGGLAGMTAALDLADRNYRTTLVEKSDKLGGNAWNLNKTWKGEDIRANLQDIIAKVENHPNIKVLKQAEVKTVDGSVGNFTSDIEAGGATETVNYGIAVLATGAEELKPQEYLYGRDSRIMTHLEFDAELRERSANVAKAGSAVFIQCVGSREPERMYCSRVCCTHSVHSAIKLKEINPDMPVYVLYRDIRTYGEREDLYTKARELGVIFIRYDLENKPKVIKDGDNLLVEVFDPIVQLPVRLPADYLVLASAIIPRRNENLLELYKFGMNADGFMNEAHPKLRPVDMTVDGLFVAGLCHHPKPIDEAVSQAMAAVSRAGVILAKERMSLDAIKSYATEKCDGCALCVDVCPYMAIKIEEYKDNGQVHRRITTDKALCKGCGLCAATCPKDGVVVHGFTTDQLQAQVDEVVAIVENAA